MVVPYGLAIHVYQWYTCTNITLSQKRLEIQALRCNGDTSKLARLVGVVSIEDITVYYS